MRASDIAAVAAAIDPDATAAGTVTSGWVDMSKFRQILAVVFTGILGTAATLDGKLQQAQDAAGTGVKDIAGKAITQLVKATDDDKQAVINCRDDELDKDNLFTHVRLSLTVAVATSDIGGVIIGLNPDYGAASDNDSSTVDEIVA